MGLIVPSILSHCTFHFISFKIVLNHNFPVFQAYQSIRIISVHTTYLYINQTIIKFKLIRNGKHFRLNHHLGKTCKVIVVNELSSIYFGVVW